MKRAIIVLLATAVFALPLRADFNAIVDAIDSQTGLKRVTVPFLGFARLAIWMVHPQGVHDFQLATWEGSVNLQPHEANAILRAGAGRGFTPVIATRSSRTGEWAFIYGRPHGNTVELMIVSHDSSDTVALRAVVDLATFTEDFNHPNDFVRLGR